MTINSGSQQRIASCGDIRLAISGAADCTPVGVVASVHSHPDRRIRAWSTRTLRRFAHHSYPFRRQRFGRRPLRRTKSTPGKQCIQAAPRTQTKEQSSRKTSSLRGKSGTIKRHKGYGCVRISPAQAARLQSNRSVIRLFREQHLSAGHLPDLDRPAVADVMDPYAAAARQHPRMRGRRTRPQPEQRFRNPRIPVTGRVLSAFAVLFPGYLPVSCLESFVDAGAAETGGAPRR